MGSGFENAVSEITLVLFTTLAPSGVMACLFIGGMLLRDTIDDACRKSLNKFFAVPLLVALVGLVASATHLGNPANALYVFTGVGRSPLSNEILAGAVFFGWAGSYWLYSFSLKRRRLLERVWIALFMVSGALFIVAIAFAYRVETIITWAQPCVPLALVLNSLVGGPLLACVAFTVADHDGTRASLPVGGLCASRRTVRACLAVCAAAALANTVVYLVGGVQMLPMRNAMVSALQLAPHYHVAVAAFALLQVLAIAVFLFSGNTGLWRKASVAEESQPWSNKQFAGRLAEAVVSSVLSLSGIFIMRFTFYMLHMTVGM